MAIMENHRSLSESLEDKVRKLKVLMTSRVIIITLLLTIILFIQLRKGVTLFITPNNFIYYFIHLPFTSSPYLLPQ